MKGLKFAAIHGVAIGQMGVDAGQFGAIGGDATWRARPVRPEGRPPVGLNRNGRSISAWTLLRPDWPEPRPGEDCGATIASPEAIRSLQDASLAEGLSRPTPSQTGGW